MLLYLRTSCLWVVFFIVEVKGAVTLETGLCWTDWINKHQTEEGVDKEILVRSDLYVYGVCRRPLAVDVARIDGLAVKEKLNCDYSGCICRDINQKPGVKCSDYMVRFLCLCHDLYGNRDNSHQSLLLCHNGPNGRFSCPSNTVMSVKSAYYGTVWLSRCGSGILSSVCRKESKDVLADMKERCNGKLHCKIPAPSQEFGGPDCGLVKKHLHVEINCVELCKRGEKVYYTGNEYIDDACTVRCTCVKGGRFVCIPLCPVRYGVVCPDKKIVRMRKKQVSNNPTCHCLVPTCFSPKILGCNNGTSLAPGEKFQRKQCKEECQCVGHNRVRCKPLCKTNTPKCKEGEKMKVDMTKTEYPECLCKTTTCVSDN